MKILNIDNYRYRYPPGFTTLDGFVGFLSNTKDKFFSMVEFNECECMFPFLIAEDIKTVFINLTRIFSVFEEEVTVLNKSEYNKRLVECSQTLCVYCEYYEGDILDKSMEGCRGALCLDGTCSSYSEV